MGPGLSVQLVLCKARLVETWIKRRETVDGARRIRSKKLRKHQYREGYTRSSEGKREEGDGDNDERMKWAVVKGAREVNGSVSMVE